MKRAWQTALGVLSALPVFCLLPLALSYDAASPEAASKPAELVTHLPAEAAHGLWIAGAGALLGLALYAFYLVWIVRTPRLSAPRKAEWVVALSLAGPIAMPALWFLHFREGEGPV